MKSPMSRLLTPCPSCGLCGLAVYGDPVQEFYKCRNCSKVTQHKQPRSRNRVTGLFYNRGRCGLQGFNYPWPFREDACVHPPEKS